MAEIRSYPATPLVQCVCVCNLVFAIPLHAARRAMAAAVGFCISVFPGYRPTEPVIVGPPTLRCGNAGRLENRRDNLLGRPPVRVRDKGRPWAEEREMT